VKRYLVGGAVRDALLGLPVRENDYVVVGATPEAMVAAGYRPVGKDFPVFLDPQTKEEHALARSERKSGRGYHGFQFHTGPEVTLEDDLARRDLTVNAIARDDSGELIDPYGGRRDLEARVLRHVTQAFAEDPVRILRVARFAARFAPLGFRVAGETMALMQQMVEAGEADHLVPERVWKETERALTQSLGVGVGGGDAPRYRPSVYFDVLHRCGALARVMPELAALAGVPQRADYHPEVDTLVHTLMCVDAAERMGFVRDVRVAALLHDLGKAATPQAEWPSHRRHDERGIALVRQFCERLRVPNSARDLALAVTRDHLIVHRAAELRPSTLLQLLERLGAFRRDDGFDRALDACLCDARGRLGMEDSDYPPVPYLREAATVARSISAAEAIAAGCSGAAIGEELARRRAAALKNWIATRRSDNP
jgi:tRNA nucleotidyltransferase (CCA-adding enzyme)